MKSKLSWKVTLAFLSVALITILTVSLLLNFGIDRHFNRFRNLEEQRQNQAIATVIEQLYAEYGEWTPVSVHVAQMAAATGRLIRIEDANGQVVFDSARVRRRPMMPHHQLVVPKTSEQDELYLSQIPLNVNGNTVGTVQIISLFRGRTVYSAEEIFYRSSINRLILLAGLAASIAALILSLAFSRRLTTPLNKIISVVSLMGQGDLKQRVQIRSDDEIQLLADTVNQLAKNLEHLEKLRKKITADIAHELRTPLTTIQGYIQGIREGVMPTSEQNWQAVDDEVARLAELVDGLQELARAEAPLWATEKIDLRDLVHKTARRMQVVFEQQKIDLQLALSDQPLFVKGDRSALERAFRNILSNAAKYTPAQGRVEVRAGKQPDGEVTLSVADTGIGIRPEDQPYIFERFFRTDQSRARVTGGIGLGLTIAKEIVQAHGGTISVKSEPGQGSQFTLVFPAVR